MNKTFILLLAMLCALLLAHACAETEYLDAAQDATAYRRAVSQMNADLNVPEGVLFAACLRGETVLCRTEGFKLTPETFDGVCAAPEQFYAGPRGCYTLRFSDYRDAEKAIDWLNRQDWIVYAEADGIVEAAGTDFDSWGAEAMGMGGYLPYASGWGSGSVKVAVLDSGAVAHSFYQGRVVNGWDYADNDDDPTNDGFNHGTHVVGILADCTRGAPVTILNIRMLNESGNGTVSNLVNAISEASDAGADIINLSMAASKVSAAIDNAVIDAKDQGIAMVVAAGNYNRDTSGVSPANIMDAGVIVVGSAELSNGMDVRASTSCYGDSVDVYAYGVSILSCDNSGGYTRKSGTSFAAPHVAATCALMKLLSPDMTPAQLEARLRLTDGASDGLAVKLGPITPSEEGFRLAELNLAPGEALSLPGAARPLTCGEAITWSLDGEGVSLSADGILTAISEGTATLTAACRGFETCSISVTVTDEAPRAMTLPPALTVLEDEALTGSRATVIDLPEGLTLVGWRALADCPELRFVRVSGAATDLDSAAMEGSGQAVLLCPLDSLAHRAARDNGWQYLISLD